MKSRTLNFTTVTIWFVALAISAQMSAQAPQRFNHLQVGKGHFQDPLSSVINKGGAARPSVDANSPRPADASASSNFIVFDVPGAVATFPLDNNAGGAITGQFFTPNGVGHGFVRSTTGTITPFDVPDAGTGSGQGTVPQGINSQGEITGYYYDADGVPCGFLRSTNGGFITFDVPGAAQTFAKNINDTGLISGDYVDALRNRSHGFVRSPNGTFTTFDAAGAFDTFVVFTGMNAKGAITGGYVDDFGFHGYLRSPNGAMIPSIDVYGAIFTAGEGTTTTNNQNVTGYSLDQGFVSHGFLRTPDGKITSIDDPNAGPAPEQGTQAFSVNPSKTITGIYLDANYVQHGFVRDRHNVYITIDPPGSVLTVTEVINTSGEVAGFFLDQNGDTHGFVWTP